MKIPEALSRIADHAKKFAFRRGLFGDNDTFYELHRKLSFIPGMTTLRELEVLYTVAASSSIEGDILEIGSWLGKSTAYLAEACRASENRCVVAVDTFLGNPGKEALYQKPLESGTSIHRQFLTNIHKASLDRWVSEFTCGSASAFVQLKHKKFRMIFIDACHDYEDVKRDILLWKGTLLPGGILALHDYRKGTPCAKAIDECVVRNKEEFCTLLSVDLLLVARKGGVK